MVIPVNLPAFSPLPACCIGTDHNVILLDAEAEEITLHPDSQTTDLRAVIIVPAYNEAGHIKAVLADLRAHVPHAHVVVVDDGSRDETAATAARGGATVLQLPFNLGVGGAMQTGYVYAWENGYDVAVQFDGDTRKMAQRMALLEKQLQDVMGEESETVDTPVSE